MRIVSTGSGRVYRRERPTPVVVDCVLSVDVLMDVGRRGEG